MRLTFQQSNDDKNVYQSNSSNQFGTGRFAEIRPKNITFQATDSQLGLFFDPNKVSSQIGSSLKKESSVQQSTNNVFNQIQFQQNEQFSSEGSEKKKGASNKYFQNQSSYVVQHDSQNDQIFCDQHGNQARFICSTVGCPIGGLCEICQHDCPNKTNIDDFFKVMELKLHNQQLDVIQNEKYKLFSSIKNYFNEMKQEILNQIDELEIKFIARVMSDTSFNTEIYHQFIPEMLELNLLDLHKKITQLSKLIYNEKIKISELSKIFVSDQNRFNKKLNQQVSQFNSLFSNFIFTCEKKLLNCPIDVSEINFRLLDEQSQFKQNKAIQNQVKTLTQQKPIQNKEIVTDLCLISNTILASSEANGTITLWKLPYFVEMQKFQHGVECSSLASIYDQQNTSFLLSAGKDGEEYQIYLWNINLGYRVGDVIGHSKQIRKLVPLNYTQIAWCQEDEKIRIWKLTDRELAHVINVHSAWINDLCKISKNCIASCSRDYTVAVIDFVSGKTQFIIKDVTYVNCITSLNCELFAFANYNGQVKIYQVEQPVLIQQIQVSNNWLETNSIWFLCSLSPETLITSSANGELNFLTLDQKKDNIIKTIQLPKAQSVQPLLYLKHFKKLLILHQGEIQVFQ